MTQLDTVYYKLALSRAAVRDLSGAISFAKIALCLNEDNDKARRLLELCDYELNWFGETAEALETVRNLVAKKKWRKAEVEAGKLPHQSARVLMARGCMLAAAGRRAKASQMFACALEKDRGNKAAQTYLTTAASRRGRLVFKVFL